MTAWIPLDSDAIDSADSEGAFNQFIQEQLDTLVEGILTDGELADFGERGSDLIVTTEDITPPTFVYGEDGQGMGGGGSGPGSDGGQMNFSVPFEVVMQLIAAKLGLPNLKKEGQGRIKQVSHEFKTFGPLGAILDKKRTFKRALKHSIATGSYRPERRQYGIQIHKRDRRYKIPQRVERPKYRAVVFYMGDISYSTYGERLELEKRLVKFIQHWLDFNYGAKNVEHRYFVHDTEAREVLPEKFYEVGNAGGTRAAMVFDLIGQIAASEYPPNATNYYGFYFGDGELFEEDAKEIVNLVESELRPLFNRLGIVEVQPSRSSHLNHKMAQRFQDDAIVRLGQIKDRKDTLNVIKKLFRGGYASGKK